MTDKFPLPLDEFGVPIDPLPMSPEQVMGLVRAMRKSAAIWSIFQRMGEYGLPDDEEFKAIELFRENYMAEHGLAHLNRNGFLGAVILLRQITVGKVAGPDSKEAQDFLREDFKRNTIVRVRPVGAIKTVSTDIVEIMWLANHVMRRTDFWPLLEDDMRNAGDPNRRYIGSERYMLFWQRKYAPYYGVINRGGIKGMASTAMRNVVRGEVPTLECAEAWGAIQSLESLYTNQALPVKRHVH